MNSSPTRLTGSTQRTAHTTSFDTVVIGAGPAGSAAAALLAEAGLRVLVIEREKFPRYHIGESLLPFTCYPLKRLGLLDKMRQSEFVKKYSVQFVSASGKASQPFYFSTRYEPEVAQTWQVLRSEFDLMLLKNARAKGATVLEETTVLELLRQENASAAGPALQTSCATGLANSPSPPLEERVGERRSPPPNEPETPALARIVGVKAKTASGEILHFHAPMTLDCSGREALAPTRLNWRVREPKLNKVAVWTYYKGAQRDAGVDGGATTVAYVPEKGWFWYIPQHKDMVSVGVVAEGKYLTRGGVREPEAIFQREIGENAWIKEHLSCGTQQGRYFLTSEFSWRSKYCASDGLLLAGDSFGFLDPVFSSGVMLALKSGVLAADAICAAFNAGDFSSSRFEHYGNTMREGIENMRKLVYAFYDPKFSFRKLTDKYPEMVGPITDCLSGDVNKDFSRLYAAVAESAEVPEPLPYGMPLVAGPQDHMTADHMTADHMTVGSGVDPRPPSHHSRTGLTQAS